MHQLCNLKEDQMVLAICPYVETSKSARQILMKLLILNKTTP